MAHALCNLSAVDGHAEREGLLIKSFWLDVAGEDSTLDFQNFDRLPKLTFKHIAEGLIGTEYRKLFLKTAILLAYTDGRMSDAESTWLKAVAAAFSMAEEFSHIEKFVRSYLLRQLSHVQNTDALREVAKELGY